tara:strand:- start:65 stop:355 length:291 start_codon:yes stop_codon:yes gene_type:complete
MDTLQAILKINPNAKVSITQKPNEDEVITWLDGTVEISQADIDAKKTEFAYIEPRERAYPSIKEQLDMMWHDKQNDTTTWEDAISKVKSDNPKGGS